MDVFLFYCDPTGNERSLHAIWGFRPIVNLEKCTFLSLEAFAFLVSAKRDILTRLTSRICLGRRVLLLECMTRLSYAYCLLGEKEVYLEGDVGC